MKLKSELGLLYFVVTVIFGFIIWNAINTPHVYFRWINGNCVKVESSDPSHNCENLPEKFIHHWVP